MKDMYKTKTNQIMGNRVAIKFNRINMTESGKIYISRDLDQGIDKALYEVKGRILNKEFENFVTVAVEGTNGCFGPNVQPSPKAMKRLLTVIKDSNYRIVQQKGQDFTLEGVN